MTELEKAIESFKPNLIDVYKTQVTAIYNDIVKKLGPQLENVYNDWTYARTFRGMVAPNITTVDKVKTLDQDKLVKNAIQFADDVVVRWHSKIVGKLENITDITYTRIDALSFSIVGKRDGHRVAINQQVILKMSSKGTLFNQFPARIFVDGKFMSEAKYKQMFA